MKKIFVVLILSSLVMTACEKQSRAIYKEDIQNYGIIHTSDKLGFDILDRNLGAARAFHPSDDMSTVGDIQKIAGNYYQYGCNSPVGTAFTLNEKYDKEHKNGEFDWSKPEETPCPEGWRIPSREEWQKIYAAFEMTQNGNIGEQTEEGARVEDALNLPHSSWWTIKGDTPEERAATDPELLLYDPTTSGSTGFDVFWSCTPVQGKGSLSERGIPQVYVFYKEFDPIIAGHEINEAMPIRCIR